MKFNISTTVQHLIAFCVLAITTLIYTPAAHANIEWPIIGDKLTLHDVEYSQTEIDSYKAILQSDKKRLKGAYRRSGYHDPETFDAKFDELFNNALDLQTDASHEIANLYIC